MQQAHMCRARVYTEICNLAGALDRHTKAFRIRNEDDALSDF
jgi:ferritin-like protein